MKVESGEVAGVLVLKNVSRLTHRRWSWDAGPGGLPVVEFPHFGLGLRQSASSFWGASRVVTQKRCLSSHWILASFKHLLFAWDLAAVHVKYWRVCGGKSQTRNRSVQFLGKGKVEKYRILWESHKETWFKSGLGWRGTVWRRAIGFWGLCRNSVPGEILVALRESCCRLKGEGWEEPATLAAGSRGPGCSWAAGESGVR